MPRTDWFPQKTIIVNDWKEEHEGGVQKLKKYFNLRKFSYACMTIFFNWIRYKSQMQQVRPEEREIDQKEKLLTNLRGILESTDLHIFPLPSN